MTSLDVLFALAGMLILLVLYKGATKEFAEVKRILKEGNRRNGKH